MACGNGAPSGMSDSSMKTYCERLSRASFTLEMTYVPSDLRYEMNTRPTLTASQLCLRSSRRLLSAPGFHAFVPPGRAGSRSCLGDDGPGHGDWQTSCGSVPYRQIESAHFARPDVSDPARIPGGVVRHRGSAYHTEQAEQAAQNDGRPTVTNVCRRAPNGASGASQTGVRGRLCGLVG